MYKRILMVAAFFLTTLVSSSFSQTYEEDREPLTLKEVIELTQAGVSDDVIIKQIKATGASFELSTDDILFLKDTGVSDQVIEAMIETAQEEPVRREVHIYHRPYPRAYYYPYPVVSFGFGLHHGGHHFHGGHPHFGHHFHPHHGHHFIGHGFGAHGLRFSKRGFTRRR